jgi:hypothetical protein
VNFVQFICVNLTLFVFRMKGLNLKVFHACPCLCMIYCSIILLALIFLIFLMQCVLVHVHAFLMLVHII